MAKDKLQPIKMVIAGTEEIRHDLFKLLVANHKKNVSYKRGEPETVDVEHCHFFHSRDDKGTRDNTHATFIAGHTHEVKVEWDESGEAIVAMHCGPAVKEFWKKGKGGRETMELVPIRYNVAENLGGGFVEDGHTHDLKYIHTQFLSKNVMEAKRKDERKKIAGMMTPTGKPSQAAAALSLESKAQHAGDIGMKAE